MATMRMYCPSLKENVEATITDGKRVRSKGGSFRNVIYGEYEGRKCLPKTVKADVFAQHGFSAETFEASGNKMEWILPVEAYPRNRGADSKWGKDFYYEKVWVERHGDEYKLNFIVRAYKPTKVHRPDKTVVSETHPYTKKGWKNGYMKWADVPMGGKRWSDEVQEKLGSFISMKAEFTPEELTKSSAIHGDFDTASINYSGHQNLMKGAEDDWQTNDEFWEMLEREYGELFDEDGYIQMTNSELRKIAKERGFDAEAVPIGNVDDDGLLAVVNDIGDHKGFIELEDDDEEDSVEIEITDDEMNEIAEIKLGAETVAFGSEAYDEMLNDMGVSVIQGYDASRLLRETDPIAYEVGMRDYESALLEDYQDDPTMYSEMFDEDEELTPEGERMLKEMYDDMLDESGIETLAENYNVSRLLKETDPIAYRVGLSDFESFESEGEYPQEFLDEFYDFDSNPTADMQDEETIAIAYRAWLHSKENQDEDYDAESCEVCAEYRILDAEGYCSECQHHAEYYETRSQEDAFFSESEIIPSKISKKGKMALGLTALGLGFAMIKADKIADWFNKR